MRKTTRERERKERGIETIRKRKRERESDRESCNVRKREKGERY